MAIGGRITDDTHRSCRPNWQQWLSIDHALLCCSGTVAVELALRGVGVSAGDEVVLAAYDFPGNFRAIEAIGATPVLIDVQTDGWVVEPNDIAQALSEKTKSNSGFASAWANYRHPKNQIDRPSFKFFDLDC